MNTDLITLLENMTDKISKDTFILPTKFQELGVQDLVINLLEEADGTSTPQIDPTTVQLYFDLDELISALTEQKDAIKKTVKTFIETNNTGSFSSGGADIKYTSATTTTTIDTAKIKSNYPDIAAACSKVSPRASSISISRTK